MFSSVQNPYGVKPLGNLFCQTADVLSKRSMSIGAFAVIPEDILLNVLGLLTIEDVCGGLCLTSRVMYVYCHHSELWRDATLNRWPGNFYYRTCWKDTYVLKLLSERDATDSFVAHVPLKVEYMFSDLLHRSWACRSYDVRSACKGFNARNNICRRAADTLSVEQFVAEFERPNIPVLIEGCCRAWGALKHDYVARGGGDSKTSPKEEQWYKTTSTTGVNLRAADILFTFDQYLAYAAQAFEEAPLYLFDSNFVDHRDQDRGVACCFHPSIGVEDFEVPVYFRRSEGLMRSQSRDQDQDQTEPRDKAECHHSRDQDQDQTEPRDKAECHHTDLFHVLHEEVEGILVRRRPDYRWLIGKIHTSFVLCGWPGSALACRVYLSLISHAVLLCPCFCSGPCLQRIFFPQGPQHDACVERSYKGTQEVDILPAGSATSGLFRVARRGGGGGTRVGG